MRIIRNKLIPPKRFDAINIFGFLFCRKGRRISKTVINHERIHTAQMCEMLFVGFYMWYVVEWCVRYFMRGNAYHNISMEREAYDNMDDADYLSHRKPYAWIGYLRRKTES